MGYESRIYIVDKHPPLASEGKGWGEVIAIFYMCVMGYDFTKLFQKETDCYIYDTDSDTKINEDCYGSPLKEASLLKVKEFLEKEIKRGNDYRRIPILLNTLNAINPERWENVVLLHYGY